MNIVESIVVEKLKETHMGTEESVEEKGDSWGPISQRSIDQAKAVMKDQGAAAQTVYAFGYECGLIDGKKDLAPILADISVFLRKHEGNYVSDSLLADIAELLEPMSGGKKK